MTEITPAPVAAPVAPAPAQAPFSTLADDAATSGPPAQSFTFTRRLDAAEELWVWKLGLRALLIILAIIGTGCMGWAFSTVSRGPYSYQLDDAWTVVWSLITFGISGIWCAVCILVLLLRRPNAPVHPGVAVGIDLILWLAFIPTAMFALIGAMSVMRFGSDGEIGQYSSYGEYTLAANGTWVWNQTEYDSYYGRERSCDTRSYSRYNDYGFENCAEEDAYVNALWQNKNHRAAVEITGVVCQFMGLALHLALFIWACVDTHRRNQRKVSKDAEKLAADIVMKMIRTGAVVPTRNQGPMAQPLLHPQQPQGWPAAAWGPAGPAPMGQAHPIPPQPVVLGPEKGDSSRFA